MVQQEGKGCMDEGIVHVNLSGVTFCGSKSRIAFGGVGLSKHVSTCLCGGGQWLHLGINGSRKGS